MTTVLGNGSSFYYWLPRAEMAKDVALETTTSTISVSSAIRMGKRTIVHVQDEEVLRRTASRQLVDDGYQVEGASHGREGVEKSRRTNPDLMLMDVNMPVMGGIEALKKLKGIPDTQSIPVIMVTAKNDIEVTLQAFSAELMEWLGDFKGQGFAEIKSQGRGIFEIGGEKVSRPLASRTAASWFWRRSAPPLKHWEPISTPPKARDWSWRTFEEGHSPASSSRLKSLATSRSCCAPFRAADPFNNIAC